MDVGEMLFGERRLFRRKPCLRLVDIHRYGDLYTGHMRDLAMGGAFVEPIWANRNNIGEELILTIPYSMREGHIKLKAKIAWTRSDGIGVRFLNLRSEHSIYS